MPHTLSAKYHEPRTLLSKYNELDLHELCHLSSTFHKLYYLNAMNSCVWWHVTPRTLSDKYRKLKYLHTTNYIIYIPPSTYHQLHHLRITSNGAFTWSSHLEKPNKRHELHHHLNTTNSIIYIPSTPSSTYITKCNGRMAVSHGQINQNITNFIF